MVWWTLSIISFYWGGGCSKFSDINSILHVPNHCNLPSQWTPFLYHNFLFFGHRYFNKLLILKNHKCFSLKSGIRFIGLLIPCKDSFFFFDNCLVVFTKFLHFSKYSKLFGISYIWFWHSPCILKNFNEYNQNGPYPTHL